MEKRGRSSKSTTNRGETTAPSHAEVADVAAVPRDVDVTDEAFDERVDVTVREARTEMPVPGTLGAGLKSQGQMPRVVVGTIAELMVGCTGLEIEIDTAIHL